MIRVVMAASACLIASAAGSQTIVLKDTAGSACEAKIFTAGQLCLNIADGVIYYKDTTGAVKAGALVLATGTGKAAMTAANAAGLASAAGLGSASPVTFGSVTTPGQVKSNLAAGGSASGHLTSSAAPAYAWQVLGQGPDGANWDILGVGDKTYMRAVNDGNSAATNWLTISRGSGYTISSIAFGAPTLLQGYTVAGLPSCTSSLKGALVHVTDAASPTYNGALTGSGAVTVPAFCNGSAWTAH